MLTFDAPTHTYRLDGEVIPSVTQLLDKLHSFAGVPLIYLEAARERGTAVHHACHYFDEDDLDEDTLTPQVRGYLEGWKKFRRESGCEIVECERMGAHPTHRFAGQWDRVLRIARTGWTGDVKTGEPHWCMGLQTAAYGALRGAPGDKRATIHLRADGTYRFKEWADPTDWPAFVSLITLHNVAKRHSHE